MEGEHKLVSKSHVSAPDYFAVNTSGTTALLKDSKLYVFTITGHALPAYTSDKWDTIDLGGIHGIKGLSVSETAIWLHTPTPQYTQLGKPTQWTELTGLDKLHSFTVARDNSILFIRSHKYGTPEQHWLTPSYPMELEGEGKKWHGVGKLFYKAPPAGADLAVRNYNALCGNGAKS